MMIIERIRRAGFGTSLEKAIAKQALGFPLLGPKENKFSYFLSFTESFPPFSSFLSSILAVIFFQEDKTMATSSQQQQQQPRILNRVSGFFMHHSKKKQASDEDTSSSSSSDDISLPPESSTHDGASSRVDSMFSSISSVRGGNPNSPPPVRTIRLDNPVVHESPPSPPSMTSTSKKRKQKLDPKQVDEAFDQLLVNDTQRGRCTPAHLLTDPFSL